MNDYKLEAAINTLTTTIYNECPSLLPQLKMVVDKINKNDPPYTLTITSSSQATIFNGDYGPELAPPKSWVVSSSNNSKSICLSVEASIALDKIVGRKQ